MQTFETIPKKWGNSIGITIPKEIVEKEGISGKEKIRVMIAGKRRTKFSEIFGSLKPKHKISTQKALDEIDKGWEY